VLCQYLFFCSSADAPRRTSFRPCALGDPCFHEFPNQGCGQGPIGRKADGAFARVVVLEVPCMGSDGLGSWIERAVLGSRTKPDEHPSIQPECRELIADALLRPRRGGLDGSPNTLEGLSLVAAQFREIVIDVLWLRVHATLHLTPAST